MPLVSQVKYDPLLTNISVQFKPTEGYVADKVLPPVPVLKESAAFWVYDKSNMDTPDSKRAPRTGYNRVDWSVSQDQYLCEQYGLEGEIDDEQRENAAEPLNLDVDTTEIVTDMVLNNRERRVAALVTDTAVMTQNVTLSGAGQWSDPDSDPIGVVKTARTTIFDVCTLRPNVMMVQNAVFEALKLHPAILERIKYSERAIVTPALLASLFEVDEFLVASAKRRSSKEGQTDAITDIWGKHALLFYREARPSLKRASLGYQMRQHDLKVFRYREDKIDTDVIRVAEKQDEKIVAAQCGYLIKDAAA